MDHIVTVLITDQALEDVEILLDVLEKQDLGLWAGVRPDGALHYIRRDLLRAVEQKVVADKLSYLLGDLCVLVFQDLLHNVVAVLVVDQLIELGKAHVYQSFLYLRLRSSQYFLDNAATMLVGGYFGAVAQNRVVQCLFMLI